jgi:NTE family protein
MGKPTTARTVERVPFVLSGGGARGFAHLGVLEACAEFGIVPSALCATSAGALVGAYIAAGLSPDEVVKLMRREVPGLFSRWRILRGDRITQERVKAFLTATLPVKRLEDLPMPLFVSVTDQASGLQHVFDRGDLVPTLLAASAVPILFPPVHIGGSRYVDGGISNNLPVEPFADRKHEVIAVYVNPLAPLNGRLSLWETVDRTVHLSFREMVARSAAGCRLYIEPPGLSSFGLFDLHHAERIRCIGRDHAREVLAHRG